MSNYIPFQNDKPSSFVTERQINTNQASNNILVIQRKSKDLLSRK